jgi:hypothetical protein
MPKAGKILAVAPAFWMAFLFCPSARAQQDPNILAPTPTPIVKFLQSPERNADTGAFVSKARAVPTPEDPNLLVRVGGGIAFPVSPVFSNNYNFGLSGQLGFGYRVAHHLTLWLSGEFESFNSKAAPPNQPGTVDQVTQWNFTLTASYRVLSSPLSPYFFAGPGLSFVSAQISPNWVVNEDDYGVPTGSETDFLLEGGIGFEYRLHPGEAVFLQSEWSLGFTSPGFAAVSQTDSPLAPTPLEIGLLFAL